MKRFRGILLFLLILFGVSSVASAQATVDTSLNRVVPDTLPARTAPILEEPAPDQVAYDSLKKVIRPYQPVPKKSAFYSCILPGAGQINNRQFWKVPIIYAGVGASIGFLIYNGTEYRRYSRAYVSRINNPNVNDEFTIRFSGYSNATVLNSLKSAQDQAKEALDLTYLLTGLGYTIQVLDALAFAHLKNFDVTQNISLRMKPVMLPTGNPALGIVMNF